MTQPQHVGMFTTVDEAEDPSLFIGLLDRIQDAPDVRAARTEVLGALALRPGQRVLDLGCGTGDHSRDVARLVVPGGEVVGVDFSRAMVEEAAGRQAASALPVSFEVGDAQRLHFEADSFDACRTERMLCHVCDCQAALKEMVRVIRPGGRVAVLDVDTAGMMIDNADRLITSAFAASITAAIRNPWIGRQLRRLFSGVGLLDIEVRPKILEIGYGVLEPMIEQHASWMIESGAVTAEALARWRQELEISNRSGSFFMGMTMFVALGRKP